jgi:hypothetical protein
MSEVEKIYKNAGIEPKKKCYYWDCPYSTGMPANDIPYTERNCQDCNNPDKAVYPPFTAEKQLELIKFLIKDYNYYLDCIDTNNFENSLAASLNDLWQDLTDADRTQIKNILE